MSEKFLKVEDLVVEYRTGGKVVHAVNNVSFELERGKTLGLVGETGAGKTTIAKTILRVLPDAQAKVKSGKVILDGADLLSLSEAAMRKVRGGQVTMVFQDPMTALNPIMKVGEQIAEVIRKHQTREDKTAREMAEDAGNGRYSKRTLRRIPASVLRRNEAARCYRNGTGLQSTSSSG